MPDYYRMNKEEWSAFKAEFSPAIKKKSPKMKKNEATGEMEEVKGEETSLFEKAKASFMKNRDFLISKVRKATRNRDNPLTYEMF